MIYFKKAVTRRHKCGGSNFLVIAESSIEILMQVFKLKVEASPDLDL